MRPTNSNPLREKIAADVAAYLSNGGTIQQLPYSPDRFSWLPNEQYERLEEARKKAQQSSCWRKSNSTLCDGHDMSSKKQRERAAAKARKFRKTGNKQAEAA